MEAAEARGRPTKSSSGTPHRCRTAATSLRVVASDSPSNAPSTALTGALESTAFDIDNTPPVITVTSVSRQAGRLMIAFDVRDENSVVQKAEYSLDGDRWQTIYPKDGIPDSRVEQFELVLDGDRNARRDHPGHRRAQQHVERARRRRRDADARQRQAVDDGTATEVEGESGFGAATSTGRGAGGIFTGGGSMAAAADAFTVVRASSHTMLTATGMPSTPCAGAKRDCFTALTTELTSSVSTAVSWRRTLARSERALHSSPRALRASPPPTARTPPRHQHRLEARAIERARWRRHRAVEAHRVLVRARVGGARNAGRTPAPTRSDAPRRRHGGAASRSMDSAGTRVGSRR